MVALASKETAGTSPEALGRLGDEVALGIGWRVKG